uniref:Integrin alpha-4 n=1 Tax=Magallana gigas TaxID=29159 RepID=K1Q7K3_MAGGI
MFDLVKLLIFVPFGYGFNVDVEKAIVYTGTPGSYYGATTEMLTNVEGNWVLVGAPRQNYSGIIKPGAVYRCPVSTSSTTTPACLMLPIRAAQSPFPANIQSEENQGLGLNMLITNNYLVACSPSWKQTVTIDTYYAYGKCSDVPFGSMNTNYNKFFAVPSGLLQTGSKIFYMVAEFGFSSAIRSGFGANGIVMGTPVVYDSTGGFIYYRESNVANFWDRFNVLEHGSTDSLTTVFRAGAYLGYSIGAGVFGPTIGSGFGQSLIVADFNNDNKDDIAVGAPMEGEDEMNKVDVGAVYIYYGTLGSDFIDASAQRLRGSGAILARFGHSIACPGDLNKDGFKDLIVGAPYEQDNKGAIYIFNGGAPRMETMYSQRILAADINNIDYTLTSDPETSDVKERRFTFYQNNVTQGTVYTKTQLFIASGETKCESLHARIAMTDRKFFARVNDDPRFEVTYKISNESAGNEVRPILDKDKASEISNVTGRFLTECTPTCKPDLMITGAALTSLVQVGKTQELEVQILVINIADPAYGASIVFNNSIGAIFSSYAVLLEQGSERMTCAKEGDGARCTFDKNPLFPQVRGLVNVRFDVSSLQLLRGVALQSLPAVAEVFAVAEVAESVTSSPGVVINPSVIITESNVPLGCGVSGVGCAVFECLITDLEVDFQAIVIQANITEENLPDIPAGTTQIQYYTTGILYPSKKLPIPLNIKPSNITYSAVLPIFPNNILARTEELNLWPLIVGLSVGVLLMVLLAIALWKLGFFRRKKREELNQYKRKSYAHARQSRALTRASRDLDAEDRKILSQYTQMN